MQHASELEQMVNILAQLAEITRKLARGQNEGHQQAISGFADDIDDVADRLVDVLFPKKETGDRNVAQSN